MTPQEIDDYCKRLAEAWKKLSDAPLGFLLEKCMYYREHDDYYIGSDEQIITAIEKMVEK